MSLAGYEIEIDATQVVTSNKKVKLVARVYLAGVYQFDYPVMIDSDFYRDAIDLPDGVARVQSIVIKRTSDHIVSLQNEAPVGAEQALDLGAYKIPLA